MSYRRQNNPRNNHSDKHNKNGSRSANTGSFLEQDDYVYIHEIINNMRDNESDEDQTMMADNFFDNCVDKELSFSSNAVASKALEILAPHSSPDVFEKFSSSLLPNLRLLVNDTSASFVIEALLKTATLRTLTINTEPEDPKKEDEPLAKKRKYSKVSSIIDYNLKLDIKPAHKLYCKQLVEKISRFLLNNLEDFINENNANHLIRASLHCLSGSISQKNSFNKVEIINLRTKHAVTISDEWCEILSDFATRLMAWPQFPDLAFVESSCIILQVICQTLKNVETQQGTLKKLVKAIMRQSFKDENESEDPEDFKAFSSSSSLHLLEAMMESCGEKLLNKIYKKFFKAKLIELSESTNLNFAVQRLIDAMNDKETFEEIFNTLAPEFTKLFQVGHNGVVLSLCKACERLGVKQGQFIQSLLKSLGCAAEKTGKCILPIIALKPLGTIEDKNECEISLHGSLILQRIFQFNKPIKIVQSLLDMKPQDIANIFCDQKGSRIADAYLESKFIGEKSREKLVKHLEGMYMKMAVSKSGSHVLEKFYNLSTETQKEMIVQELAERVNQLNGCVPGRIINFKFNVETYAKNPNQWKNFMSRKTLNNSH